LLLYNHNQEKDLIPMKKLFVLMMVFMATTGCVIETTETFVPSLSSGCFTSDHDYSHTEFDCIDYSVSYVFCDSSRDHPRFRHWDCYWPDEVPEVFDGGCVSYNICH